MGSTMYDASYRPDAATSIRVDAVESHRRSSSALGHQPPDTPVYEVSQMSNEDEDDDASCDLEPVEYSTASTRAGGGSMFANAAYGAANATKSVLQTGARLFYQQRQCIQMGEGPTLLRLLCFLGGFVMLTSSILSTVNIFTFLTSPSTYVLQMYQGFFGIVTMVVEAKNWDCFDHFKPWMTEWFRFLTVPAGKGAFYLFVGSLGVSLWLRNLFSFVVGLYMSFMGVICIAVHAGTNWRPQCEQGYCSPLQQHDDTLTTAFHECVDHHNVYDDEHDGSHANAMMRPETTTTSSGHSLVAAGKHKPQVKRYAHDAPAMSALSMSGY